MLSGSMSGYSVIGYDLGGFMHENKKASAEEKEAAVYDIENVCRRICQSILFVPVPRVHSGEASPKLPWIFPEESRPLLKACLKKRYSWIPYIYSCAVNSVRCGAPIVSPLAYHHTDDRAAYAIEDEFYMGDTLLFAPVVVRGATSRSVYLPEGRWTDLWSGECFDGKATVERETPLLKIEGLPVFAKCGCAMVSTEPQLTVQEETPESITIAFYGLESGIVLWENENLCNTFRCSENMLYLENNTTEKRTYHTVIYDVSGPKAKIVHEHTYHAEPFGRIIDKLR